MNAKCDTVCIVSLFFCLHSTQAVVSISYIIGILWSRRWSNHVRNSCRVCSHSLIRLFVRPSISLASWLASWLTAFACLLDPCARSLSHSFHSLLFITVEELFSSLWWKMIVIGELVDGKGWEALARRLQDLTDDDDWLASFLNELKVCTS